MDAACHRGVNIAYKAWGLSLLLSSVLFVALGQGSIASSDDALYAQMAFEMSERGAWLTATWMGVDVFEKPPLLLWMLKVFGPPLGWSEFSLRLPGVLASFITFYYIIRLAHDETTSLFPGVVAGFAVLATLTFTLNARRPMTDALLCASVMATLWYTLSLMRSPRRSAAIALGIAGGLGCLAKWVALGPVALVSAIGLLRMRRFNALAWATASALIVASPWFVAMSLQHGGAFWDVFLGYHVLERAGASLVGSEPLSFYAETLWQLDGLFGAALILGIPTLLIVRRSDLTWLLASCALLTLVVIHASSTRLYHYLMPVIPLAALSLALVVSKERLALGGMACLSLVAFLFGPLDPTLLRPDFAPSSKSVGASLSVVPEEAEVISWEDYDPAMMWYAKRPIRIWTQSESMATAQNSIDMMRRAEAVVLATPARLQTLGQERHTIFLVAPKERASGLLRWIQGLTHRSVGVDAESSERHIIVRLGSMT